MLSETSMLSEKPDILIYRTLRMGRPRLGRRPLGKQDAPGRIRTSDPRIRSPTLCPLSYRGSPASVAAGSARATVGAATCFVERDGDLAVRRTQDMQDDAALERPSGWSGAPLGSASSG